MKYTKKIGDGFFTFEKEDIDKYAPGSIKEAFTMWWQICLMVAIGLLILIGISKLLLLICP